MTLKNTSSSYGSLSKLLHWSIALIAIGMLAAGFTMANIDSSPLRTTIANNHKSFGIIILVLMLCRLWWRSINISPRLPATVPQWQRLAARTVHYSFYIALIAMPLSGWIMSSAAGYPPQFFGLFTLPSIAPESKALSSFFRGVHGVLAWTIVSLITIHTLAALKHHFIDKNDVLRKIM